jgi:2-polyprenyl-6-methoxyphenol hydroxylase-like FAD-dependent oxidoreductase
VKCLTQILADAVYSGSTIDALDHLLKYEQQRLRHNFPIMMGIHGIQRLYNNDFTPLVALRSAGLRITNALPPLKVSAKQLMVPRKDF